MKALLLLILPIIMVWNAQARRADTPPVPPVTYSGVIYSAPHSGSIGGVIEAHDQATNAKLWSKRVYGVEYSGGLEEDYQWIYVRSLFITNGLLYIVNEANHTFTLDLKTRDVTALSKDVVAFEALRYATATASNGRIDVPPPECLEITCTLLKIDQSTIETLVKEGQLNTENIMSIWRGNKGCLLACPSMIVISGRESIIKSVKEIIYPTELALPDGSRTNLSTNSSLTPVPSGFEMREVGVIMQCVAEVKHPSEIIHANICLQYVCEPSWKTYVSEIRNPQGRPLEVRLEQPFFPVYSFQNAVNFQNGTTILLGSGIPTADNKAFVFALLTGKLVNKDESSGSPINP